jgi:hypothetical protein
MRRNNGRGSFQDVSEPAGPAILLAEASRGAAFGDLNNDGKIDVVVAYELVKSGAEMEVIAAKMKTGKTVWQTADEQHADWKQIASDAKKLNGKVDTNLLGHFGSNKAETQRDQVDGYDPFRDSVNADNDVSKQEIEDAQQRYVFLRDHASVASASTLDTSTERSARIVRTDPVRSGGPTGGPSSAPRKTEPGKNETGGREPRGNTAHSLDY